MRGRQGRKKGHEHMSAERKKRMDENFVMVKIVLKLQAMLRGIRGRKRARQMVVSTMDFQRIFRGWKGRIKARAKADAEMTGLFGKGLWLQGEDEETGEKVGAWHYVLQLDDECGGAEIVIHSNASYEMVEMHGKMRRGCMKRQIICPCPGTEPEERGFYEEPSGLVSFWPQEALNHYLENVLHAEPTAVTARKARIAAAKEKVTEKAALAVQCAIRQKKARQKKRKKRKEKAERIKQKNHAARRKKEHENERKQMSAAAGIMQKNFRAWKDVKENMPEEAKALRKKHQEKLLEDKKERHKQAVKIQAILRGKKQRE